MDAKLRIASMDFHRKIAWALMDAKLRIVSMDFYRKSRMGIDGREVANCQHGLLLEKSHGR